MYGDTKNRGCQISYDTWTVLQSHFNHCGSPVKLVQACLNAREDEDPLVLSSCEAICCNICDICASSPYPLSGSRSGIFYNSVLVVSICC